MMVCRRLIQSALCIGLATSVATAYAADPEPKAEVTNADAAAGTTATEEKSEEAAPAADSASVTKAEAKDGDEKGKAKKVAQQVGATNIAIAGGSSQRPFFVAGTLQFRTPVITDEDPANDRSMNYLLTAGFKLTPGVQLLGRLNLQQGFVAQGGALPDGLPGGTLDFSGFDESVNDSAFRLGNLQLGALVIQPVELSVGEFERNVLLMHRGSVYLPTSREAQIQDFYLGLEYLGLARMRMVDQLYLNLAGMMQWRGHEFSTQVGPNGRPFPRFVFLGQVAVEYVLGLGETFGSVTFGADIAGSETVNYPSPENFESETSEQVYIRPGYGYDLYVAWVPLPYLSASVAWTQGGNAVRNGVLNTFFFHRDETRLAFSVTARY